MADAEAYCLMERCAEPAYPNGPWRGLCFRHARTAARDSGAPTPSSPPPGAPRVPAAAAPDPLAALATSPVSTTLGRPSSRPLVCKVDDCDEPAEKRTGPRAYLCQRHGDERMAELRAEGQEASTAAIAATQRAMPEASTSREPAPAQRTFLDVARDTARAIDAAVELRARSAETAEMLAAAERRVDELFAELAAFRRTT